VTKPELIERMADRSSYLTQTDTTLICGTFSRRNARNPKAGETVQIEARSSEHFKAGLELRERVKNSSQRTIPI